MAAAAPAAKRTRVERACDGEAAGAGCAAGSSGGGALNLAVACGIAQEFVKFVLFSTGQLPR